MVRKSMDDDNEDVDNVHRKFVSEEENIDIPRNNELSDFCFDNIKKHTSNTLLALISKLVSGGKTSKKSLTLSQCIQQHMGSYKESRRN